MTSAYIVKTGERFLSSGEDGDIGLATEVDEAKRFLSHEEASEAANKSGHPECEILVVDISQG